MDIFLLINVSVHCIDYLTSHYSHLQSYKLI